MNKKMFEDYRGNQKMLLVDKELLIREYQVMEHSIKVLPDGMINELQKEYVNSIKSSMKKLAEQQKQVLEAVNNLKNTNAKIAMQIKYIEGGTFYDVAEKLNVSYWMATKYLREAFNELGITD